MKSLKQQCWRYWLAMNASAFDAAVHACAAYFGVAGAHAALDSVPALNLQQFAAVFAITFARGVLNYLQSHPVSALAALLDTSESAARVAAAPAQSTTCLGQASGAAGVGNPQS